MRKPAVGVEKLLHKRLLFREFEGKIGIAAEEYCTARGQRLSRGEGEGLCAFGDILFASSGKKYAKNAAKTKFLEIA